MGVPVVDTGPMIVEEFYLLTDGRPDDEKWELIEGEPILNASPSPVHQRILGNLVFALGLQERASDTDWAAIPGIGALVSRTSRPEPDAMILPKHVFRRHPQRRDTENATVLFEIMSPSTAGRDLQWKRAAYTKLNALMHYVVIAQDAVDVVVFSRTEQFAERRWRTLSDAIVFPEIGVTLSLTEIYRDIPPFHESRSR